jgi:23S rRNA pseudouridine1911/1915/1917 synthase
MTDEFWRTVTIDEHAAGWRVDSYLSRRFSKYSRTQIANYIKEQKIISTHRRLKSSSRLQQGEELRLYVPGLAPSGPPPPPPPIVFQDDDVVVVNKPSGMLVHPAGSQFVWALVGLIKDHFPDSDVDLVHRLDRETSGVVLLTKNKAANSFLKKSLQARQIHKVYHAVVRGTPDWESHDLHAPIGVSQNSKLRIRRCVTEGGQASHTTFNVLKRFDDLSLVECILHTGRTHQIRVHLDHLGFPILGDKIYGQPDETFIEYIDGGMTEELMEKLVMPRHALHAYSVDFPHPNGGKNHVHAPVWQDMQFVIKNGHVPIN